MKEEKKPLLVLAGPTAVGKTALSLSLAERLSGSIISADSMQVYRRLNIGSAKIRPEEMRGIPHYLVDELEPSEEFSVYRFQKMAKAAIEDILSEGRLPILTGGTGFYIQAVLRDIQFEENSGTSAYRKELEEKAEKEGPDAVWKILLKADPESAKAIPPGNRKRVIRALEFYRETGMRISEHNAQQRKKTSPYRHAYFVLTDERPLLYERIDQRVDKMVSEGLFEEVRALLQEGLTSENTSMKGIGYRELIPYFQGKITREEAIRQVKTDTRHFAKRQLTWFRREKEVIWVDRSRFHQDDEAMLQYMCDQWKGIP